MRKKATAEQDEMDRKIRKLCERKNMWNAKSRQKRRQRERIGEKNYKEEPTI